MSESPIMRRMMLALSRAGAVVFRNNVAQAIAGKATWIKERCTVTLNPGDVVVRQGRVLHAGLIKGSGDLIGWKSVVVTPEMVGRTVAIFVSVEAKGERGVSSPEQKTWRKNVTDAGGMAGEARNDVDALAIISE